MFFWFIIADHLVPDKFVEQILNVYLMILLYFL